jgi:hypothetical protein
MTCPQWPRASGAANARTTRARFWQDFNRGGGPLLPLILPEVIRLSRKPSALRANPPEGRGKRCRLHQFF